MSEHIAHPDPTAVLDTAAKFFRVMNKAGAPFEAFTPPMQSVAKRRNLAEYLNFGCPKVDGNGVINTTPSEHELACLILADDFITPEEVANARGLVYTNEQLEALEESFPTLEIIAWCRENGYMLLPNPPKAMSFLEIRDLKREFFYSKEIGWYDNQAFAREEKTKAATWLAIRKGIVPNSINKKWKKQLKLITDVERVLNVAELSWALTTYKEVRGIYLMREAIYARTSNVCSDGRRLSVGNFDLNGLILVVYWEDDCHSDLGLFSARRF